MARSHWEGSSDSLHILRIGLEVKRGPRNLYVWESPNPNYDTFTHSQLLSAMRAH